MTKRGRRPREREFRSRKEIRQKVNLLKSIAKDLRVEQFDSCLGHPKLQMCQSCKWGTRIKKK